MECFFDLHKSQVPLRRQPSRRRTSAGALQACDRRVSGMRPSMVKLLPAMPASALSWCHGQFTDYQTFGSRVKILPN